jgi:hypothetical protein
VDEQGQFRGIKVEDAEKKAQAAAQQTIASSSTIPDAQKQTLIGNLSTYDLFPLTHDLKTAIVSNQLTAVGVTGPANNNNTKAIVQSTEMAVAPAIPQGMPRLGQLADWEQAQRFTELGGKRNWVFGGGKG